MLTGAVPVDRPLLEDFRPRPFENGEWVSLRECFVFSSSGVQTKRDKLVYGRTKQELSDRLRTFAAANDEKAASMFHDSRDRKWSLARQSLLDNRSAIEINPASLQNVAYRPFDRRAAYNDARFGDFMRPALQATWGNSNSALYAMPLGTGRGPAVWAHGLLPDYHAFRGSYGGYAFPLFDRRAGPEATNLSPALVAALGGVYGQPTVTPPDIFHAILALLSATSYTRRFAEDLEDVFPHVPFPATRAVFDRAVAVGREIRAVETFARAPEARFRPRDFFRLTTPPTAGAPLIPTAMTDAGFALCADGSGAVTGIAAAVWDFAVSGYRVLPRWIEGRKGLPAEAVWPELRDVAARIAELIHRFDEADLVLAETLEDSLTREEMGFAPPLAPIPDTER